MLNTLSYRLSPEKHPTIFTVEKTNKKFTNQATTLILRYIADNKMCDHDTVKDTILNEYHYATGSRPINPNYMYNSNVLFDTLNSLHDKEYLDLLDIAIQVLLREKDTYYWMSASVFIEEMNELFRRNGIGLFIQNGRCMPSTDETVVNEITIPAFNILLRYNLIAARDCLDSAFIAYKEGRFPDSIQNASNAIESVIDYIINHNHPEVEKGGKTSKKISILVQDGTIPTYLMNNFDSLCKMLETTTTIRNNNSGHGKEETVEIPEVLVKYVLDSSASCILFLVRTFVGEYN